MLKQSIIVKEELEEKRKLEEFLNILSRKKRTKKDKENNKKTKDRGGNDGKRRRQNNTTQHNNEDLTPHQQSKDEIRKIILSHNIASDHQEFDAHILPELTHDQKILVNWDYEGVNIDKDDSLLSASFTEEKKLSQENIERKQYSFKEYDLNIIPCWSEMKKFDNFKKMSIPIRKQLSAIGFPPSKLKDLNLYDVGYLIKKHNTENFPNVMPCQRTNFLKMFATCYGEEFLRIETLLGRLDTAEAFLKYIKHLNTKKPNTIEMQKAANLYNIHHIRNRQHANELNDYSKINCFSNMTLCYANPYHTILHIEYKSAKSNRNIKSLNLNNQIIYLGGLRRDFFILRNSSIENTNKKNKYTKMPRLK